MNLKSKTFLLFLLGLQATALAQTMQERKNNLEQLAVERKSNHDSQAAKAKEYAKKHNVPLSYVDYKGNDVLLIGVDDSGFPIYQTTLNEDAAITTGVNKLRTGGSVGVNLEGQGIIVGVWDGGKVKDHTEFKTRLNTVQGSEVSSHATHVTGTILAEGKVADAKGMAPKAIATTWDYDDDESEMITLSRPDQTTLLLSNHSYGIQMGWVFNGTTWSWTGNSTISSSEDYRFGFYSSKSRSLDQLAFNAPYYTMVWAAGNDRGSAGTGSFPPDCNGGTGYDCLGQEGVAKNTISVGAVEKVVTYTGPTSVKMSTFSSWGPTDDGRIKPDFVADGVNVYSTYVTSAGADTYKSESGTSMAAPNATGSLVLLQELYKNLHAGNYMKAATLRALAIHTTKEAGDFPGPDYSFGWGLLDVEAAAQILLADDQKTVVVSENSLLNGQVFEYEFEPKANSKITATIVWTDPAAAPLAPGLDPVKRMLVNDLDIRLVNDANALTFPWTLDPNSPTSAASKDKDNDRDNVEKIEFDTPEPRVYKVRVTHKGQLVNGKQDFSLILNFTPSDEPSTAFYWIGDSGDWNNPANWSLTSGGPAAGQIPDANGRVIFNENSFTGSGDVVTLTADAACASLTWLAKNNSDLSLNGYKLQVNGNLIATSSDFSVASAGSLEFVSTAAVNRQINMGSNDFSKASIIINSDIKTTWTINGGIDAGSIDLQKGKLVAKNSNLKLGKLISNTNNERILDLTGAKITTLIESAIGGTNLQLFTEGASVKMNSLDTTTMIWSGIKYDGSLEVVGGQLNFTGNATIKELVLSGDLQIDGDNTIQKFTAAAGAFLQLKPGSRQTFTSDIVLNSTLANKITIRTSAAGTAELAFGGHFKKCFDFLTVSNINLNLGGEATISAGANSTLTNATNWIAGACGNALFSDFLFRYNCQGAITEFTNASEGNITTYAWDFGDPSSSNNTSTEASPKHLYENSGIYSVKLTVNDGTTVKSYTRQMEIINNDLEPNKVIIANGKLFSFLTAEGYQWFKNESKLDGAVGRWLEYSGDAGTYYVLTKSTLCNIPSSLFTVAEIPEETNSLIKEIAVFPNPAIDEVNLKMPQEALPAKVTLTNALGQVVLRTNITTEDTSIALRNMPEGLYVMDIRAKVSLKRKFVVKR